MNTIQPPGDQFAMRLEYDGPRDAFVLTIQDGIGQAHSAVLDDTTLDALRDLVAIHDAKGRQPQHPDMQVQVTRRRWANMGDHAEYVTEGQTYDPTETVEALVSRVFRLQETYMRHDPADAITLRVVEGTEPERPQTVTGASQGIF